MDMSDAVTPHPLTLQMLSWLASRSRSYGETMNAWRTSCPRLSIWEDALADQLIRVGRADPGVGQGGAPVELTSRGRAVLARSGKRPADDERLPSPARPERLLAAEGAAQVHGLAGVGVRQSHLNRA